VIRVEHSVQISRSPEEVFGHLTDVARVPEWQSSAVEMRTAGSLAQGSRIFEKRRLMGRELDNELEVVAFDPPRRLTLRSLGGPVKLTIDHELAAVDGGTRLTVVASGKAGSLMKLAEPMIARTAEAELREDFERLKELLEGS
jgi:carbon monoxide dehydrogenase subunit G